MADVPHPAAAVPDVLVRETPSWFDEAKLGMFVLWGPAAIPAFAPLSRIGEIEDDPDEVKTWRRMPHAEMYQNTMHIPGSAVARHHAERYGDLPYDAFVERFRDEMIPGWDPEPLADLAAGMGARYVVLTAKMEDGFLMWPSATPNPRKQGWQSKRDVVGGLADAVRARGLRFGVYYDTGIDWTFGGLPITDRASERAAFLHTDEYQAYADAHWRELVERYEPSVLWNDYSYPKRADPADLFRWYLDRVPDGVVNDRFEADPYAAAEPPSGVYRDFVTPEYSVEGSPDPKWEACRGIGRSFGFNRQESDATYMSSNELIHMFVDIVARGGNLLAGVGPTATGEAPWAQAQRLLALGWWLRVNGEAVYGTRPWDRHAGVTAEGAEVRYTCSVDAVHAIVLGSPREAAVEIDVELHGDAQVSLAGRASALRWSSSPCGVRVELPEPPDGTPALSLRLKPRDAVRPFDET